MYTPEFDVSVVIPYKNLVGMTVACVRSILPSAGVFEPWFEVILVDDHSTEVLSLDGLKGVRIVPCEGTGPTAAMATAIKAASRKYILFCNNDMLFTGPGMVRNLAIRYRKLCHELTVQGILCCTLYEPKDVGDFDSGEEWEARIARAPELAPKRRIHEQGAQPWFTEVELLRDPEFSPDTEFKICYQDWDIYERLLRKHHWILSTEEARVLHYSNRTIRYKDEAVQQAIKHDRERYWTKWPVSLWTMRNYGRPFGL